MTLWRWPFQCLLSATIVPLCVAVLSTEVALNACHYASENFYIVNSSDSYEQFPNGYVNCANATETDVTRCSICSCREKRVAFVSGVAVAWIVCAEVKEEAKCVSSGTSIREFCSDSYSQDSSGSVDEVYITVGSHASSDMNGIDGSDASMEGSSISEMVIPDPSIEVSVVNDSSVANAGTSSASANIDLNGSSDIDATTKSNETSMKIDQSPSGSDGSSIDTIASFDNSIFVSNFTGNTTKATLPFKGLGSQSSGVVTADVGSVQTNTTTVIEEQVIQPSDDKSSQNLETTNGSSSKSNWSGTRLLAILTLIGGFTAIAVLSVIIAVRKNHASKNSELGTPTEDDTSTLAIPVTHRFDGKQHHPSQRSTRQSTVESPSLAPAVVVGTSDRNHYVLGHDHRLIISEAKGKRPRSFAHVESAHASNRLDTSYYNAIGASQLQFNTSHGPSAINLPTPALYPIYDTSNTHVRFSSIQSSDCAPSSSERMFASEESSIDSYQKLSETSSKDRLHGSEALTESRKHKPKQQRMNSDMFIPTKSFASSLSSYEYATRDTEASEHLHPSELGATSSCTTVSIELESESFRSGLYRDENEF